MSVDLNLIGNRYNLIVLLFFITYVTIQPIAVATMRKIGPRIFIPTIVMVWGLLLIGFGFVHHWYQLLPLRVILGLLEGGLIPSAVYLMSCWYVRHELNIRNALFYVLGVLASAFSGILSYGFAQMNGVGSGPSWIGLHHGPTKTDPTAPTYIESGIAGWRWIFIWQGILTCLVAVGGYIFMVDFPEMTMKGRYWIPFLTQREVEFMVARVEKDREDVALEKYASMHSTCRPSR
jgi:MFS family permease